MNDTAIGTAARAVALAIVLVLAAAAGLVAGNAISGMNDANAGAINRSRTATAAFSLDALQALQSIRGDGRVASEEYLDYGLRHPVAAQEYLDYGLRHPAAAETDDGDSATNGPTAPTPR